MEALLRNIGHSAGQEIPLTPSPDVVLYQFIVTEIP